MNDTVRLELPFGYDPPNFYCPACGAGLLTMDEEGECPHAVFVHVTSGGEPSYVVPEYADIWYEIAEAEPDDEVEEFLKRIDGKQYLKLNVTFGGMACEPAWYTATMVINFAPEPVAEQ